MAKRNKAKFAAKSRKSALRVEALEQRQLLATVTGAGTEVGSNIVHPNGNTYDQVLLTGSSVTVTADVGQITRVSFLDLNGDIVQAEFSGKGQMTVSLDTDPTKGFKTGVQPTNYNQTLPQGYSQGLASITVSGEDATTNLNIFTVGAGTAVNKSLFDATHQGGNNLADIARVLIVADPVNPQGSAMGSITAGNVVFSDTTGTVGIAAANVAVQNKVVVGDIIAQNSALPTLNFGVNSQFGVVQVAGGGLVSQNGAAIVDGSDSLAGYVYGINFVDGATSKFISGTTPTTDASYLKAQVFNGTLTTFKDFAHLATTVDTTSAIDITGKSQSDLNTIFNGRTFTSDVTITGVLDTGFNITAAAFRGNLTFVNEVKGNVTLFDYNNVAQPVAAIGKTLTFQDKVSGTIKAESLGDISFAKGFTGKVQSGDSFDGRTGGGAATTTLLDGAIGNITVTGDLSGVFAADWKIGNITVSGNVTSDGSTNTGGNGVFLTSGNNAVQIGNVGTLTINGDVDLKTATDNLINITGQGNFGDVKILGGGALGSSTTAAKLGSIVVNSLGAGQSTTGAVTVTEGNAVDLNFGGVRITGGGGGTLGAISVTGGDAIKTDLTLSGNIGGGNVTVGNVSIAKFNDVALTGSITGSALGAISVTDTTGTNAEPSSITVGGAITAGSGGSITSVTLSAGNTPSLTTGSSNVTFNADIVGKTIGDITVTGDTVTLNGGFGVNSSASGSTVGNITFNGDVTSTAAAATSATLDLRGAKAITINGKLTTADVTGGAFLKSQGTIDSLTVTGDTTLVTGTNVDTTAGTITNAITFKNLTVGAATKINTGSVGGLVFNGTTNLGAATGVTFVANNGGSGLDTIGSVTVNGTIKGGAGNYDITASKVGNVTVSGALLENGSLVESFGILAANNANAADSTKAETVARDGSNLSSYTIGNVTVTNTNTIGLTGTALFKGANFFDSIGGVGNVSLVGGGSQNVQTQLFQAGGTAEFVAGMRGVDMDGNGTVGTVFITGPASTVADLQNAETKSDFTGGTVSIGDVTLNVARVAPTAAQPNNNDTILAVNGLTILSGTYKAAATGAVTDYKNIDGGNVTTDASTVGNLKGNIGNILVTNANQQLSRADYLASSGTSAPAGGVALAAITNPLAGAVIVASGSTGTVQGAANSKLTATNDYTVIGQESADANPNNVVTSELIIYIV